MQKNVKLKLKMKIVKKKEDEDLFIKSWLDYQNKNIVGIGHSLDIIEYYLITNRKNIVSDESFVILGEANDKICLAICFLPIYTDNIINYCNAIAPIANKEKYLKICFEYIDKVSKEFNLDKIEFSIDVSYSQHGQWKYNYLRDYGYIDCTVNNYIFNLSEKAEFLFQKFNTSSRNIVRKAMKEGNCEVIVYDENNITNKIFDNYKSYHRICAGKQTRNNESFDYMLSLIRNKRSILLELNYEKQPIGYLIVFLFFPYASLSSIANLPEYEREVPIYRLLYWKAIEYCENYKLMIYGYPAGSSLIDGFNSYMDKKQLNIAKYKRYMGGIMVPHFKGIKYFNKNLAKKEVQYFFEKIKNGL